MTAVRPPSNELGAEFLARVPRPDEARFCFIIWDLLHFPQDSRIRGVLAPERRIVFRFENAVILAGRDPWPFYEALPTPTGEMSLCFDPDLREEVGERFQNLRLLDPAGRGRVNRFRCLECARGQFRPSEHEAAHPTEHLTPALVERLVAVDSKLRRMAELGTPTYVRCEGDRVLSWAPAPHVVKWERFSFAVVRSVSTIPRVRGQGYASACMSALCRHLWDEVGLDWIYLWVEEWNMPARRMYENLGFRESGVWWGCAARERRAGRRGRK